MLGSLPTPLAGGSSAKGQRPVVGPGRHARLVSSLLLDGDAIAWSWQQLTTCLQRWDSESKGELTGVHTRGHQPMWGPATHHAQAGRNSLVALESVHTEMSCCGHSVPSAPDWGVGERQPSTEKPWGSEVPAQQVGRKLTCEGKRREVHRPSPPLQCRKYSVQKQKTKFPSVGHLGFRLGAVARGPGLYEGRRDCSEAGAKRHTARSRPQGQRPLCY